MLSCLLILGKNIQEYGNWQVARQSSRPKSCRPRSESCRPRSESCRPRSESCRLKVFVMSPEILSHVA